MKKEPKVNSNNFKISVSGTVGAICAIVGLVIKFSVEICDDQILKDLVIVLFFLATICAIYILSNALIETAKILKYVVYLACIVFYIILAIYINNKHCKVPVKATTEIREGNTDNSLHINNQKNNYTTKPTQRHLTKSDIALVVSKIPDKRANIYVQYLLAKPADTLLSDQLVSALSSLGYTEVHLSPATDLSGDLTPGRLSILKNTIDSVTVYKLIVNPQQ